MRMHDRTSHEIRAKNAEAQAYIDRENADKATVITWAIDHWIELLMTLAMIAGFVWLINHVMDRENDVHYPQQQRGYDAQRVPNAVREITEIIESKEKK